MNSAVCVAPSISSIDELHRRYCQDPKSDWTDALRMFCENEWFCNLLSAMAGSAVRKAGLPKSCTADVEQAAILVFAHAVKQDSTLGFNRQRGTLESLLSTIVYRCCLKGLRQFRNTHGTVTHREDRHPTYEPWECVDEHLDLQAVAARLPEPFLTTVHLYLGGQTIGEIAVAMQRSERTVYRWLDEAVRQLRERMRVQ